jgi:hypothetical protein
MTYANQIEMMDLVPLTVRVPPAYTALMRAYANYIRAQTTWDIAYMERVDTAEQESLIREIAGRNMRTLPSPRELMERQKAASKGTSPIDKMITKLLGAAHAHFMEVRRLSEVLSWMHDRTSLDAAATAAKRMANVYMCAALLEYDEALHDSGSHGMWTPQYRLPINGDGK